jgi:hypothetical protein
MEKSRKQLFEEAQKRAILRQYLEQRRPRLDLALRLGVLEKGLKRGERAILNRYR